MPAAAKRALNCGLDLASHAYVCVVDADSILEPGALDKVMAPIIKDPGRVVASSGVVLVGKRLAAVPNTTGSGLSSSWLERIQVVEYLRAFLVERMCWSSRNMLMIISGAFGVFRKDQILKLGGYRPNTMAEDLDLVIRLHRNLLEEGKDYKISLIPNSFSGSLLGPTDRGAIIDEVPCEAASALAPGFAGCLACKPGHVP